MQVRFCVFFEKKSFLIHYEQQKNRKKFPFSRFSPPQSAPVPAGKGKIRPSARLKPARNGGRSRRCRSRSCGNAKRARSAFDSTQVRPPRRALPVLQSRTVHRANPSHRRRGAGPPRIRHPCPHGKTKGRNGFSDRSGLTRGSKDHWEVAWIMSSMMLTDSLRYGSESSSSVLFFLEELERSL